MACTGAVGDVDADAPSDADYPVLGLRRSRGGEVTAAPPLLPRHSPRCLRYALVRPWAGLVAALLLAAWRTASAQYIPQNGTSVLVMHMDASSLPAGARSTLTDVTVSASVQRQHAQHFFLVVRTNRCCGLSPFRVQRYVGRSAVARGGTPSIACNLFRGHRAAVRRRYRRCSRRSVLSTAPCVVTKSCFRARAVCCRVVRERRQTVSWALPPPLSLLSSPTRATTSLD